MFVGVFSLFLCSGVSWLAALLRLLTCPQELEGLHLTLTRNDQANTEEWDPQNHQESNHYNNSAKEKRRNHHNTYYIPKVSVIKPACNDLVCDSSPPYPQQCLPRALRFGSHALGPVPPLFALTFVTPASVHRFDPAKQLTKHC